MSDVVFGEVDWNDGDVSDGTQSDFLRLERGKTRVRVMGNPLQFYIHWVEVDGKKSKVNSPTSDPSLVTRLNDAGFPRKARWMIKVLDRSSSQFKLLEISSQIYNGIKALHQDEDWGKLTAYDITIDRGAPGQQPLYRVTPTPKTKLEQEFKSQYQSFNDRVDLSKIVQPSEPSKVLETMGWRAESAQESDSEDDDLFSFEG